MTTTTTIGVPLCQIRQVGGEPPWLNETHALREDGRPACGRNADDWDSNEMRVEDAGFGIPTCGHRACQKAAGR